MTKEKKYLDTKAQKVGLRILNITVYIDLIALESTYSYIPTQSSCWTSKWVYYQILMSN